MASFFKALIVAALGVALGLGATWLAVERGYGFGAVNAGPWTSWPKTGSSEADPYARAVMARTAEVPLGAAEGMSFIAMTDGRGAALDARCEYIVRSPVPSARFWSLTPMSPKGGRLAPEDLRAGYTSAEVVRAQNGDFAIQLSREPRPGNWMPMPAAGPFLLMFRLYDTQFSAVSSGLDAASMPRIERGACT